MSKVSEMGIGTELPMDGVREYGEQSAVCLLRCDRSFMEVDYGRLVIVSSNDGGFNGTYVDLLDLIAWVKANAPELLK